MKCPACKKGILKKGVKPLLFTYKEKSITLKQPGMWCNHCEEGVLSGSDISVTEKAFEKFKLKVDDVLNPQDIRRIRKNILKLTQKDAAKIFGGGKNAFSRYERGEVKPNLAVNNLLKEFDRHPEDVEYFKTS